DGRGVPDDCREIRQHRRPPVGTYPRPLPSGLRNETMDVADSGKETASSDPNGVPRPCRDGTPPVVRVPCVLLARHSREAGSAERSHLPRYYGESLISTPDVAGHLCSRVLQTESGEPAPQRGTCGAADRRPRTSPRVRG